MTEPPQPVQPIEVEYFNAPYAAARENPLWRVVRALAIFGVILGGYGVLAPIFGIRGIFTYSRMITTYSYNARTPWSTPFIVVEWFLSAILVVGAIACLCRQNSGRRGMVVFAIASLVLIGCSHLINLIYALSVAGSAVSGSQWLNQLMYIAASITNRLVYPVLILVFLRDPAVRELFGDARVR